MHMDTKTNQIKLKIDLSDKAAHYYKSIFNWENEGGAIPNTGDAPIVDVPFHVGDRFEVLSGVLDIEDDELIFVADIRRISENS